MKHKRNFTLLLLAGIFAVALPVSADKPEENPAETLDPFEYKELEFRQKTEYLHDRGQVEMKNTISEAQINLDFSERVVTPSPIEVSELFLEPGRSETGTAAAKAAELGLFTEKAPGSEAAAKEPTQVSMEQAEGAPVRNWIFISAIVLAVGGLFAFVVPALLKGGNGGAQPVRRRNETEGKIA